MFYSNLEFSAGNYTVPGMLVKYSDQIQVLFEIYANIMLIFCIVNRML